MTRWRDRRVGSGGRVLAHAPLLPTWGSLSQRGLPWKNAPEPRFRRPLGFAHVRAVFFTWDTVGAATWEMIDDARLFLHGKFVFGLNQLLSEVSPRPNRC